MIHNLENRFTMEMESRVLNILQQIGIRRSQVVLDFGCGYGAYTLSAAGIVGEQGRVYALDKDRGALNYLMQKAESAGLENIEKIETSGELEIGLTNEAVDAVFLFDVFHSFYFPKAEDRTRLLDEIHRVMKPSGILSITIWPNSMESGAEREIKNAGFCLEKEVPKMLNADDKDFETPRVLNFRKIS